MLQGKTTNLSSDSYYTKQIVQSFSIGDSISLNGLIASLFKLSWRTGGLEVISFQVSEQKEYIAIKGQKAQSRRGIDK